ncbi:MAG: class I SAM-dependent methyltransferase [Pirellulaceae bacterium]|nr:class I SAM-dependent methyltransferase [Pirellulaceae bacterium]
MSLDYALGNSVSAAQRLELQDKQFATVSEQLLDDLDIGLADQVIELGIGPGTFGRRVLNRLGPTGRLMGVDYTPTLLEQATTRLTRDGDTRFEPVLSDICDFDRWLHPASVILARTVLHHLPFAEVFLGELRQRLQPQTRIGFIEPEFRIPVVNLVVQIERGRHDLRPLLTWNRHIIDYYSRCGISLDIGVTMPQALRDAGFQNLRHRWQPTPLDKVVLQNMLLFYEEVREKITAMGVCTEAEIDRQLEQISELAPVGLPAVWGTHSVTCVA